ncbi:MAG TPA: endonuclease VII domain-containing protein, partial [Puia sp.]|nr:endonuclease VII domain-containing protein [Puia sp.]
MSESISQIGSKVCTKCQIRQPFSEFYSHKLTSDKLQSWCKTCSRVAMRENQLRTLYGVTPEKYNELFEFQRGRCAICGKHQSELKRKLFVDHNHETGKVRGLLCFKCNTA